jgi:hypothetical protein
MISTRTLLFCLVFAGSLPVSASADWFLTPFYGVTFGRQTSLVDLEGATGTTKQVFGGSVSWVGDGIVGVEGDVAYAPSYFQRGEGVLVVDSSLTTVMGSVVVTTPLSWTRESLRPYVVGGVGWMRASTNDTLSALPVNDNLWALDVGGGVMGFFNDRTGVRFELRYFSSLGEPQGAASFGSARLSQWRASVGLVLRRTFF